MVKYDLGVPHHMKYRKLNNRTKIIEELGKEELRFKELLERIDVSRATLSKHLNQLLEEGEVHQMMSKVLYEARKAVEYRLAQEKKTKKK